ncbi:MAG: leucine-rich repeat domain-containing protein [Prevotella sp.]|nr:leucine-rich repeat domain-containing protein [Prevotella sp.]
MRTFTFKGLFLTAVFMLLGCLSIQAANEELITKQITIKLDKAGTLPDKIASSEMYKITNLKITGEINGTDWKMIREMAGSNYKGEPTEGKLSVLDLSEARIVNGGGEYYCYGYNCYTSNDVIGEYAFKGCSGLTSLNLPAGITSIGSRAFYGCSGLTSLNLPADITYIGLYAFYGCSGLTSLTIPTGVSIINEYAFYDCSSLTRLDLPSSIREIYHSAFMNCRNLTSLTIPSNVTYISSRAFSGCSSLKNITLPTRIFGIGDNAFYGCSNLNSLTLSYELREINEYAFCDCNGLTSIYVYADKVPKMREDVFKGCDAKKCTIYVPKGTYGDYRSSEFGYFENIVEFDATGIDKTTTSTDVEEVSRYSVNGQRLVGPTKGLNIVKYSDGSVKKVAVE